jgi:hypothetical protein
VGKGLRSGENKLKLSKSKLGDLGQIIQLLSFFLSFLIFGGIGFELRALHLQSRGSTV